MDSRSNVAERSQRPGRVAVVSGRHPATAIAAFDFDKTLTTKHTFWRLLWRAVGPLRFGAGVIRLSPAILEFFRRRVTLLELRERTIHYFLAGFPADRFRALCEDFARRSIPRWIRQTAAERIAWHQQRGDRILIVSNAPEDYLVPWADSVGISAVLGSRFEVEEDRLTGRLLGTHCYGEEKVKRLRELLGDLGRYEIYAYGDSPGDLPMLRIATHGYYRTFSEVMPRPAD